MPKIGLILNNIGTPRSAAPKDVAVYLNEFLMDPDVIGLPYLLRALLVKGIIVPFRSKSSAKKYQAIWSERGSPLLYLTEELQNQLQIHLGETYSVKIGMRYGQPSLENALKQLQQEGVQDVIFAPLFPQYSEATTASASKYFEILNKKHGFKSKILKPFYKEQFFLLPSVALILEKIKSTKPDYFLFSYHGLPESLVKKTPDCLQENCCIAVGACEKNCYKAQCHRTSELLAGQLGLSNDHWSTSFQSRLGPAKWIGPSTIEESDRILALGKTSVCVVAPSFVTDCLETAEELGIELNQHFKNRTGKDLDLVPCLNGSSEWAAAFATYIKKNFNF